MSDFSLIIGLIVGSLVFGVIIKNFSVISFDGCWGFISLWFTCVILSTLLVGPILGAILMGVGVIIKWILIIGVFIAAILGILYVIHCVIKGRGDD